MKIRDKITKQDKGKPQGTKLRLLLKHGPVTIAKLTDGRTILRVVGLSWRRWYLMLPAHPIEDHFCMLLRSETIPMQFWGKDPDYVSENEKLILEGYKDQMIENPNQPSAATSTPVAMAWPNQTST